MIRLFSIQERFCKSLEILQRTDPKRNWLETNLKPRVKDT